MSDAADVKISLNVNMPFSENKGDCLPDDPAYRVRYWQGRQITVTNKMGKKVKATVLLPFDEEHELVPDDGRKEPWQGVSQLVDKQGITIPVFHHPLWNDDMRALLAVVTKEAQERAETGDEEGEVDMEWVTDRVNWVGWLTGSEQYDWAVLQQAAKKKFGQAYTTKKDLVIDLVVERKVVGRDHVCPALSKFVPVKAAREAA